MSKRKDRGLGWDPALATKLVLPDPLSLRFMKAKEAKK